MGSSGDRMVEKKYGLLFPGQGAQSVGMGKEFYETSSLARRVFDRADEVLGRGISDLCFEGPEEELVETANSQPAIYTVSLATMGAILEMSGSEPKEALFSAEDVARVATLVMGLSLGEPTALVAAGAISFEDGLRFVERRGKLMDEASKAYPGRMASIMGLDKEDLEELCMGLGGCQIANLNCPGQVVISGSADKVELACDLAKTRGAKRAILLKVSGAFHSDLMEEARKKLAAFLSEIDISSPAISFVSNIDGNITRDPEVIRENLAKQLTNRTLWQACMETAISKGVSDFLEVGPGKVLKGLARKIDSTANVASVHSQSDIKALFG